MISIDNAPCIERKIRITNSVDRLGAIRMRLMIRACMICCGVLSLNTYTSTQEKEMSTEITASLLNGSRVLLIFLVKWMGLELGFFIR